jgi:hypothetical protein
VSYLARLKQKISEDAPHCEATKVSEASFVPFVAPVPTPLRQISAAVIDHEAFEERPAIREFDGGYTRREAERLARADLKMEEITDGK